MRSTVRVISFYFFFFQAEDGIRDIGVTGVQTCALPIWPARPPRRRAARPPPHLRRLRGKRRSGRGGADDALGDRGGGVRRGRAGGGGRGGGRGGAPMTPGEPEAGSSDGLEPAEALEELPEEIVDGLGLDAAIEIEESAGVLTGGLDGEDRSEER